MDGVDTWTRAEGVARLGGAAVSVGMVAAGGAGLLLEGRAEAFAAADDGQYHHRGNRVGRARPIVSHLYTVQEYLCTVAEETRS